MWVNQLPSNIGDYIIHIKYIPGHIQSPRGILATISTLPYRMAVLDMSFPDITGFR